MTLAQLHITHPIAPRRARRGIVGAGGGGPVGVFVGGTGKGGGEWETGAERSEFGFADCFCLRGGGGAGEGGELGDDFGGDVAEEVGDGDEAAADDARGDFGDAVVGLVFAMNGQVIGRVIDDLRPHCDGKEIISLVGAFGTGDARDEVHDA